MTQKRTAYLPRNPQMTQKYDLACIDTVNKGLTIMAVGIMAVHWDIVIYSKHLENKVLMWSVYTNIPID